MSLKIAKAVRLVALVLMLTVGGCITLLWENYEATRPNPCASVGARRGLSNVVELAEQGNMRPAYCAGELRGNAVYFRAIGE